jgi:hypothetical protein
MFFFLSIFAFLINLNYIGYNENFLLCIFFILFFTIAYSLIKKTFKEFIFIKIFKNFFIILLILKLNIYFNKVLTFYYLIKHNILIKYINKILLIKKKNVIKLNNIFSYYLIVLNFIYYININKNIKFKQFFTNLNCLNFLNILKKNDFILFF